MIKISQWTHICGLIRIDDITSIFGDKNLNAIKERLRTKVPTGSEGPLKTKLIINDGPGVNAYTVAIWGDLRDYGEDDEDVWRITDWIKTLTDGLIIRDFSIVINREFKEKTILYLRDEDTEIHFMQIRDSMTFERDFPKGFSTITK